MKLKPMTIEDGGEIAEFIKKYKGKTIRCFGTCDKDRVMNIFVGYEHDDGLADKDGKRFWVYFECPKCGYGHAFGKMEYFLRRSKWSS